MTVITILSLMKLTRNCCLYSGSSLLNLAVRGVPPFHGSRPNLQSSISPLLDVVDRFWQQSVIPLDPARVDGLVDGGQVTSRC